MDSLSIFWSQWTIYFSIIVFSLYKWGIRKYDFFQRKGVPFTKPLPFVGNFGGILVQRNNLNDLIQHEYAKYKGKRVFGIFEMKNALLTIRDPELIKQITVKDFDNFLDHRAPIDEESEPLFGRSLIMLKGQKWRDMRSTLSPAFTGSKMRQMFQLIVACTEEATKCLLSEATRSKVPFVPEMKDIFTRLANDVIATNAFGIKVNSLENKENEFYLMGKRATKFSAWVALKLFIVLSFPRFTKFFKIRFFGNDQSRFYRSLVQTTIAYREREGIVRHDMINLLMEAKKGSLVYQPEQERVKDGFATVEESNHIHVTAKRVWEDDDITAQCMLFFIAGFETSATLMAFTAYELTVNPDVQKRLIEEIDEWRNQLNGKLITYDIIQKMKYLDMVICESLRMWPPVVATDRICVKPYVIEDDKGMKINIDKGDMIWIPVTGLHHDPDYYPNPNNFDPERFSDENKDNIRSFTYLPFGSGPRNCIGSRFALMECKAVLFYLLSAFTFEVSDTTQIPLKIGNKGFNLQSEKGINIHLKPRA